MTSPTVSGLLRAWETDAVHTPARLFPSSFDGNDADLTALPRSLDWNWTSCAQALKYFDAKTVLLRLPLFWQVESPLVAACRPIGAAVFCNDLDNMPVGAAAIKHAGANVVVTTYSDMLAFLNYLQDRNADQPEGWVVALREDERTPSEIQVNCAYEVHLAPGVPILVQCPRLYNTNHAFHATDDFTIDITDDASYLSSTADDPYRFERFPLTSTLRENGTCACGKRLIERV